MLGRKGTSNVIRGFTGCRRLFAAAPDQNDDFSSVEPIKDRVNLKNLRKGSGSRSSFNGVVATVFGAPGYLGRSVCNQLGKRGTQVIAPYRGDPYDSRDLKLVGDIGQILFMPYHLENDDSLRKAMRYSSVVINCVGKFNPTTNFSLNKVHVDGAARIARIAREMGVEQFVHVSAMNCSEDAQPLVTQSGVEFLRAKAKGEKEVRREFPEAIIVRPADMWGGFDKFLIYFIQRARRIRTLTGKVFLPLYKKGYATIKQPVYFQDVSKGIVNALMLSSSPGQIYQAVGPHRYYLRDLITWLYLHLRFSPEALRDFRIVDMNSLLLLKIRIRQHFSQLTPWASLQRLEYESHSDVVDPNLPTLEDLGINLTKLEDRIAWEVKPFRKYGFYWDALGEFPEPENPPLADDLHYQRKDEHLLGML